MIMAMLVVVVESTVAGLGWAGRGRTELTQEPVQLLLIYYFMNCF